MYWQTASVAIVTMFWPEASPVVNSRPEVDVVALDGELQVDELAVAGRLLRSRSEGLDRVGTPRPRTCAASASVSKANPGRAADAFVQDERRAAARLGEQARAAGVRGDQGRLGGRQRHVVVAVGEKPVHAQRAGETDRHLHRADEVLDVARVRVALCQRLRIGKLRS